MEDKEFVANVKRILKECIENLDSVKWMFVMNPEKDFTRDRKISFEKFINICLQMEGGTLQNELLKYFNFSDDTPTKSAFCQQRAKVHPEALEFLFRMFTEILLDLGAPKTFRGFRLLACDGSDINIPYNPMDAESFHQCADKRGYNQLHLNAFFDILNGIYVDCILESDRKSHERYAFNTMIDRLGLSLKIPAIIMADRGYEAYNTFAHLLKSGQKFLIRLKDENSNGIISTWDFAPHRDENNEFDCEIETILTWKQTNNIKENWQSYTYVAKEKFDFYENDNPFFPMALRIVCINVAPDTYEYLATNLDCEEFPLSVLKELYHLRWGEETSFRDLKYTIDILHFHARKRAFVEQEAWARLVVYNFCEAIIRYIALPEQKDVGRKRKHDQKINFAVGACICKNYLKRNDNDINVCRLIQRFLIPIRPGRSSPREIKPQSAKYFVYRAS